MGTVTTENLENGTKNVILTGINSTGITNIEYNGSTISSSTLTVELDGYNNRNSDRVNFAVKKSKISQYSSFNSVKLRFKATPVDTNDCAMEFTVTKETNLESNCYENIISYSKALDGWVHEIDITQIIEENDEVIYFAVRPEIGDVYFHTQNSQFVPQLIFNIVHCENGFLNQKYISGNAGRALNYDINVRTGQPFFTKSLISLGGNLMPINLELVYNGTYTSTALFNGMPYGWKTNYHQKMMVDATGNNIYIDAKGNEHRFEKALNSNNTYFDVAGTGLILTINSASEYKFTIDDGYKNYLDFDTSGYLLRIRKVVGVNVISTIINYDASKRISSIVDGMGRTFNISYNTSNMVTKIIISGTGIKDITLTMIGNSLINLKECEDRTYTYEYANNLLSVVKSDSGERLYFTYNGFGQVIRIEEKVYKTESTTINSYDLSYKCGKTLVTTFKGIKVAYIFNSEGEFLGMHEYTEYVDGILKFNYNNTYETYSQMIRDEKFYGYDNFYLNLNNETEVSPTTCSNISMKEGEMYIISFTYKISNVYSASQEQFKLEVYQDKKKVLEFYPDFTKNVETSVAYPFISNGVCMPIIKAYHKNTSGSSNYKNIKIYKIEPVEIHECINKQCGGSWSINGVGYDWYEIPKNNKFKYSTSGNNVEVDSPMYYVDIAENQKNFKLSSTTFNVWYNKKRGMVANVSSVEIIFGNYAYQLFDFLNAKVFIDKYQTKWTYSVISTLLSDPSKLMYQYNYILKDGVKNYSYALLNTDYLVITSRDFDGIISSYSYDSFGLLTFKEVSKNNKKYKYTKTYSSTHYLIKDIEYTGGSSLVTNYQFDESTGNLLTVSYLNGTVINFTYDNKTNEFIKLSILDGSLENSNTVTYDKDKIQTILSNVYGHKFTYDKYNLMTLAQIYSSGSLYPHIEIVNTCTNNCDTVLRKFANGFSNEYIYDKYGNLISYKFIDNSNNSVKNSLQFLYSNKNSNEINGFLSEEELSVNKSLSSKLRFIRDKNSNFMTFYYNNKGQLYSKVNDSLSELSYINYSYDTLDRLANETIVLKDGVDIPTCESTFTYRDDNLNNLLDVSMVETELSWNYGSANYTVSYTSSNEIDDLRRVAKETLEVDDNTCIKEYGYTSSNNVTSPYPSGITYKTKNYTTTTTIGTISYTYDSMNRITAISDTLNGNSIYYKYDLLGRIVREDNSKLNISQTWTYDQYGNITTKKVGSYTTGDITTNTTKSYVYSSTYKDRIINYAGYSANYDSMGNMTSYRGNTLTWSGNRLESFITSNNNSYTFSYNDYGKRRSKSISSTKNTNYFYDGDRLIYETRIDGSTEKDIYYIYNSSEIIGFVYENKKYYYIKNLQGDIIKLMDSSNNVVATYVYDAWGNHKVYNASGVENTTSTWIGNINPFRYRGYYYDVETQLYWVSSRYYSPELCRWISPDSIEYLDSQSINGLNLYAYCGNDPINRFDPTGYSWESFWNGVGDWFSDHWKEVVIGTAFIVGGALVTALTAGAGVGFMAAFGSALLSSTIQVGISVGTSVLVGGLVSVANGGGFFDNVGDNIASAYMWGGIFSGGAQILGGGFRIAANKGVTTGRAGGIKLGNSGVKILSPDKNNWAKAGGTLIKFGNGFRIDTGAMWGLHMHILSSGHLPIGAVIAGFIGTEY